MDKLGGYYQSYKSQYNNNNDIDVDLRQQQHGSAPFRYLVNQGFTCGLASTVLESSQKAFALRIWVVDNSGSMSARDGHRVVPEEKKELKRYDKSSTVSVGGGDEVGCRIESCTRWEEICETVRYHAHLAAIMETPTIFRLLNDPGSNVGQQQFSIAEEGSEYIEEDLEIMENIISCAKPEGVTPLSKHIKEIREGLFSIASQLRSSGQKVCIVIATDGLPTDEEGYGGPDITNEFIASLKSLEGLPIWLVIRLCTDEPQVCQFYSDLDGELEISLDVIDDFMDEATEVTKHNQWLTYAYPLHCLRELGINDRVFDMIDERPLTRGELYNFCCVLFGVRSLPDPAVEWVNFVKSIERLQKRETKVWNPTKTKKTTWIDLRKLHAEHGDGSKCVIM